MVEEARLESVYTPTGYPGFESPSLRWKELQNKENPCKLILYGDFLFLVHGKNKHIKALGQRNNLRDFIFKHII